MNSISQDPRSALTTLSRASVSVLLIGAALSCLGAGCGQGSDATIVVPSTKPTATVPSVSEIVVTSSVSMTVPPTQDVLKGWKRPSGYPSYYTTDTILEVMPPDQNPYTKDTPKECFRFGDIKPCVMSEEKSPDGQWTFQLMQDDKHMDFFLGLVSKSGKWQEVPNSVRYVTTTPDGTAFVFMNTKWQLVVAPFADLSSTTCLTNCVKNGDKYPITISPWGWNWHWEGESLVFDTDFNNTNPSSTHIRINIKTSTNQ